MPLPLKAQLALRSVWDDAEAPVHKAMGRVRDEIGKSVSCQPDFPILVSELDSFFDDKGVLVTTAVSFIQAWCRMLADLADDERNEEWAGRMLDTLSEERAYGIPIKLQVSKSAESTATWEKTVKAFVITLPRDSTAIPQDFTEEWKRSLLTAFPEATEATGDDWAEIKPDGLVSRPAEPAAGSNYLPDADQLPRPNDILQRPPYRITLHTTGSGIDILSNHSASLELMQKYLQRWCKTNYQLTNEPKLLDIKLHDSPFGLGAMYDRLSLRIPERQYIVDHISPHLVISLIETTLGYDNIFTDSNTWHFKRTALFK